MLRIECSGNRVARCAWLLLRVNSWLAYMVAPGTSTLLSSSEARLVHACAHCTATWDSLTFLLLQVNIMDWVANGSFKGDLEMLDKSGNGVGKIHVAVKFERPGQSGPHTVRPAPPFFLSLPCTGINTCQSKRLLSGCFVSK